jgi:hypothetical protein
VPRVVVFAVALWALSALLRVVPLQALLALTGSLGPSWYFTPVHPGGWFVLPLQVVLGVFLLRGHAWSRVATAVLVGVLLLVQFSSALGLRFGDFPLGLAREVAIGTLHIAAVVLLFLPNANGWFSRRKRRGAGSVETR